MWLAASSRTCCLHFPAMMNWLYSKSRSNKLSIHWVDVVRIFCHSNRQSNEGHHCHLITLEDPVVSLGCYLPTKVEKKERAETNRCRRHPNPLRIPLQCAKSKQGWGDQHKKSNCIRQSGPESGFKFRHNRKSCRSAHRSKLIGDFQSFWTIGAVSAFTLCCHRHTGVLKMGQESA